MIRKKILLALIVGFALVGVGIGAYAIDQPETMPPLQLTLLTTLRR